MVILKKAKFLHAIPQGVPADPEETGCPNLVTLRGLEGLANEIPFHLL